MRKTFLLVLLCATGISYLNAQTNTFPSTGAAGIGTLTPESSSLLDVKSTTKGVLIPRMTKAQRDLIASPVEGLLIYQSNSTPGFYYYNGSAWAAVSSKGVNKSLSNLTSPTAINADLLPNADNTINVGSSGVGWKALYLTGNIYSGGNRFISNDGTNTWLGLYAGLLNSGTYNSAFGYSSLNSNTSGSSNTAMGYSTLSVNSTGSYNTAIGQAVLYSNTTGLGNTASGFGALYLNTSGSYNNAYGHYSLFHNTTGYSNISVGNAALYSNTTGHNLVAIGDSALYNQTINGAGNYFSTAVGSKALYSNTTGFRNTANGYQTLYFNTGGSSNLATGAYSLFHNTTGYANTAIGTAALYSNTTGHNLVAVGDSALYNQAVSATGRYNNTAVGSWALYSNTNGYQNTADGSHALASNTTGYANTAHGAYALYANLAGISNTATGNYALYQNISSFNTAIGDIALNSNTTGNHNTAIGGSALTQNGNGEANTAVGFAAFYTNTTGSFNTALGEGADVSTGSLINATAIGFDAVVDANDKVRIGNADVTSIGGQVGWTTFPSDGRYKKNIKEDVKGLAFINSLRPITYTIDMERLNAYFDKGKKHDEAYEKMKTAMQPSNEETSKIIFNGFIAQEVEATAKKLNYNFSGVDKPKTADGLYGIRYSDFVVPLVKAVQELSNKNDSLKTTNQSQQQMISNLLSRVDKLELAITIIQQCSPCNPSGATVQTYNTTISDGAALEQNIPNPFALNTSIGYTLPQKFTKAQIMITDKNGKTLKVVNVSGAGKGKVNVDASTLAAGAYNYSLLVDGKLIGTKQMVLTR